MTEAPVALALHGGAGRGWEGPPPAQIAANLRETLEVARGRLQGGAAALDVVTEAVAGLEASGLYLAGRGAAPSTAGRYELDASLMDGQDGRAGAVAGLAGFQSPIAAARAVMEHTPHLLLAGEGAAAFARAQGLAEVADPASWFSRDSWASEASGHGTVGCVALDRSGRLAAATSTGGVRGKLAGRVGDSPLIGAGTWADREVAVSCTGIGEYFIRTAAAAQLAFRLRFAGQSLDEAAAAVLAEVTALGGVGGLIAIRRDGSLAVPFAADRMRRAALFPDGRILVEPE